ncbi:MAG: DUF2752 domain-containing protein [Bacteroidales bacterium]|nr:DUF2752 domain-containing protein [Bacteroidales bacterium]
MKPREKHIGIVAVLAGYLYLFITRSGLDTSRDFTVCLFKRLTGVPCPGCGTIRATRLLFQGDIIGSVMTNPLGMVLLVCSVAFIALSVTDIVQKTDRVGQIATRPLRKWQMAVLLALVATNWVWNIVKMN